MLMISVSKVKNTKSATSFPALVNQICNRFLFLTPFFPQDGFKVFLFSFPYKTQKPMTPDEQLKFCRVCQLRKFDANVGVVCSLTNAKPNFTDQCPTFKIDQPEATRLAELERSAKESEEQGKSLEGRGIKLGVLGGVIMITVAVFWLFAGLAADRIFFYPPVLLVVGIYAVIKGVLGGNIAGGKKR
jgi:hypothetical protein